MPTFKEFVKLAEITVRDKTSGARARQIAAILRRHQVARGITPEKAVRVLEELGPTFVKMGQVASNRADILPKAYCDAFHSLRASVTPMEFSQVRGIIEASCGKPLEQLFASVEEKPLGSASIAQVHKAYLPDGSPVAVKVRRPGIERQMAEDITLMRHLLALAEFTVPDDARSLVLSAGSLLDELERTCAEELDFTVETTNLVRFRDVCSRQRGVSSPLPYPELTTSEVLVMEFVDGPSITSPEAAPTPEERAQLGERLTESYVAQVVDEGFFHADPHPGNIVVRGNEIVWIDLGMTGSLSAAERAGVARMFSAVAARSATDLADAIVALTGTSDVENHARLLRQLDAMLARYASSELESLDVGDAFSDVTEVMRSQGLAMPPSLTMLGRGFLTLEGVLTDLAPQTNVVGILQDHVRRQMVSLEGARDVVGGALTDAAASARAAARLPKQASDMLDMLARGQARVTTDMRFEGSFNAMAYTVSGLLADALISAGLFVGSSILCTTGMQPQLFGVPLLGVLGYVGAGVLGVYAVWLAWKMRHAARK